MPHFCTKQFFLAFVCLVAVPLLSEAQQNSATTNPYGKVSIASPSAASLGKYVDIPVSYHTGIPQISVPLYTITEGNLSLPISLSYHAGGIKVQEPASWVGSGWALNAGGVITRTVIGGPDERGTSAFHSLNHFSDYGYNSYLKCYASFAPNIPNRAVLCDESQADDIYNIQAGHYDTEPDIFFFNFNGYTGKFFFSDDRTPVLVDGSDLKIEYYYPFCPPLPPHIGTGGGGTSTKSANIQGFVITVPSGDKYYFGITDTSPITGAEPVETTFPMSADANGMPDQVYSSYYLHKVVAADGGHVVNFTYQGENYSYYTLSMVPINGNAIQSGSGRKEYGLIKNNINGVRLAKISFSAGAVDFNGLQDPRLDLGKYTTNVGVMFDEPNDEAKALGSVTVRGADFCKKFVFDYGYFEDNASALAPTLGVSYNIITDKKRLKLNSVTEQTCDNSLGTAPWRFTYYSDFLPRRLSFAQDHWGFYNGQTNNNALNTLIPTFSINNLVPAQSTNTATSDIVPGADRDSAWPAMVNGTLTKVTYPTGGSSSFEFEPNTTWIIYTKYENQSAGGVAAGRNAGGNLSPPPITLPASPGGYKISLRLTIQGSNPSGTATFSGPGLSLSVNKTKLYDEVVIPPTSAPQTWKLRADDNSGPVILAEAQVSERVFVNGQQNALVGGLRIKKVTGQGGAASPPVVTSYGYERNGQSTATLYSRPRYVQIIRNDIVAKYGWWSSLTNEMVNYHTFGCVAPDYANTTTFLVSPSPIIPMSTTQGSHVGYDEVTVTQAGNGRAEYYYYGAPYNKRYDDVCYRVVSPKICDPTIPSLPAIPVPFDYSRGQLKLERTFNESGRMLKQTQYTYQYDSSKTITPVYIVKWVTQGGSLPNYYEKRSYWKTRMETIETTMADSGRQELQLRKTYKYDSPYHRQLTSLTTTLSAGNTTEVRNQYVRDLLPPTVSALEDGSTAYSAACRVCDQQLAATADTCTTSGALNTVYQFNRVCRASARKAYVAYRRQTFTDPVNAYRTAHDQAKASADQPLRALYQLQDDGHNELVETSRWRNQHLLGATLTTFGPGLGSPAATYPAQQFALTLASPALTFAPAAVVGTGLGRDSRYALSPETTLRFEQGNMVEVRSRTGVVTAYLWDYHATLPVAKAVGVDYRSLRAAYGGVGSLGALRAAPALAHALLTTYLHHPLVGITEQTDPTGRALRYEYDALGRLVRTRDEQHRILSQQQYHYAGR
jgi:YD repeat-containing protein